MPLQEILDELAEIRAQKFPEVVDYDDNVMKKPHEHYKENAVFAVFLYKQFQGIGALEHEQFAVKFDAAKSHADRTRLLLEDDAARTVLEELADRLLADNEQADNVRKCATKCAQARTAGNKHFSRKEYDKALACYNEVRTFFNL